MPSTAATALLTTQEAAERLRVPSTWLAQAAREGAEPFVRLGPRYVRFTEEQLTQIIEEGTVAARASLPRNSSRGLL